jgi:hypothetical protein
MVRNTLKQFSNMMVEAKRIERLIKKRKIQDVKIPSTFTEEQETDMNLHVNIIHKHGSQPSTLVTSFKFFYETFFNPIKYYFLPQKPIITISLF